MCWAWKESATFICAVHEPLNLHMCVLLAKCHPKSTKLIDAGPGGTLSHLNVLELHPIPPVWLYV
jgi:hypothetical protein